MTKKSKYQSPKISVVLPFYNAEQTLNRAIESIARQTLQNFECILVDNNSTDNSGQIAQHWIQNDSRFRLLSEEKQGVVFASNSGARQARGKYIARMDADDWSFPDRLEKQYIYLEKNPEYGAVAGLVEYIPHKAGCEGFKRYVAWSNSIRSHQEIFNRQFVEMPLVNPTAMWRKSISDNLGLYQNGNFPEDYEMWLRWLGCGVKIYKLPDKILRWYDSESRLTRTNPVYSDRSFYEIKTKYLASWLKENNPHYPQVTVWGASKISRNRALLLEKYNIEIRMFIDIKNTRQIGKRIIYYTNIPTPEEIFILVYMKEETARRRIQSFLLKRNFIEGRNYLLVS